MSHHDPSRSEIKRAMDLISTAAVEGRRCPQKHELRESRISHETIPMMARDGLLRIEVSGRNYRVVWITDKFHPAYGKHTAFPPARYSDPYVTIGPERPA